MRVQSRRSRDRHRDMFDDSTWSYDLSKMTMLARGSHTPRLVFQTKVSYSKNDSNHCSHDFNVPLSHDEILNLYTSQYIQEKWKRIPDHAIRLRVTVNSFSIEINVLQVWLGRRTTQLWQMKLGSAFGLLGWCNGFQIIQPVGMHIQLLQSERCLGR